MTLGLSLPSNPWFFDVNVFYSHLFFLVFSVVTKLQSECRALRDQGKGKQKPFETQCVFVFVGTKALAGSEVSYSL